MHSVLDLREGATFAQQFRVIRPLAKGGMGAVYVVEQLGTKRERALKLMHPMLVSDERSRERFEREAQVSGQIHSDHVVEVIAAGVESTTGTPWLCMELLSGEELSVRMARGPLGAGEVLEVVKQLGHALGAAHKAGIVHRDLKPENLFLAVARREGAPFTLKVLDFGVAALVHEASGKSTATQGVGSPLWMSPEQTNVGNVQPATDVWALGLLAYHFLTGGIYWKSASTEGSTLTALLVEVMVEPLVSASQRAADQGRGGLLPRGFDAWFARCVVRDPAARFAEGGAAMAELVAVLSGQTPSMAPQTAPQAFAATMEVTSPLGGTTGPPAQLASFPQTASLSGPTPVPTPATVPMPATSAISASQAAPVSASPRSPRSGPSWLIGGALMAGLLLCGAGVLFMAAQAASSVVASMPPHLDVTSEDGTHIEITSNGTRISLPDAGSVVVAGDLVVHGEETGGLDEPVVAPTIEGVAFDEEEESEAPLAPVAPRAPRTHASRGSHAESPAARLLRARLTRCVDGNLAGEPRARWTFTLHFNRFGTADSARIEGPHAGEDGAYRVFRRCVQMDIAGFDSGGDSGPFSLMLP